MVRTGSSGSAIKKKVLTDKKHQLLDFKVLPVEPRVNWSKYSGGSV